MFLKTGISIIGNCGDAVNIHSVVDSDNVDLISIIRDNFYEHVTVEFYTNGSLLPVNTVNHHSFYFYLNLPGSTISYRETPDGVASVI